MKVSCSTLPTTQVESRYVPYDPTEAEHYATMLLQTPAELHPQIMEIEAQVYSLHQGDKGGAKPPVDFDVFDLTIMLRETFINLFIPFSIPVLYWWEGLEGLKRRDLYGLNRFPGWFIQMGQYMLSFFTWVAIAIAIAKPKILAKEQLMVDFLYMLSCLAIRHILVGYKWAISAPYKSTTSQMRRANEVIFGWLAFSNVTVTQQAVKTITHARLEMQLPAVVMSQGREVTGDIRLGDSEFVHALAAAPVADTKQFAALSMRPSHASMLNEDDDDDEEEEEEEDKAAVVLSAGDSGRVSPRPDESSGGGSSMDDDKRRHGGGDDHDAHRDSLVLVDTLELDAASSPPPLRPSSASPQPIVASSSSSPSFRARSVKNPISNTAGQSGKQVAMVIPFLDPADTKYTSKALRLRGFGDAVNMSFVRIFNEIALRGKMGDWPQARLVLRLLLALITSLAAPLIRGLLGGHGMFGKSLQGRIIAITCTLEVFMINFNFQSAFLECCLVSYSRMLYYMRELLVLTTQDPMLLELSTLKVRAVPIYMPLCLRSNLLGWIKLRKALLRLGHTFHKRIQVFCALTFARLLLCIIIIFHHSIFRNEFSPILVCLTTIELTIFAAMALSIVNTGIQTHQIMDQQLLQLKHLRMDWEVDQSIQSKKLANAAVAEQRLVTLVIEYAESDRQLNGLKLLGINMDNRANVNIIAAVLPILWGIYNMSKLFRYSGHQSSQ